MNVCCVTGNRPQKFPWKYGEGEPHKKYLLMLKGEIEKLIGDGYGYFISGGAAGVDLDFAEAVIEAKCVSKDVLLEIAVPCKNHNSKWPKSDKNRYDKIISAADFVNVLSDSYTPFCMQIRNEYMVDKSDLVIAFWNGEKTGGTFNTINYAKRKNKRVIVYRLQARF